MCVNGCKTVRLEPDDFPQRAGYAMVLLGRSLNERALCTEYSLRQSIRAAWRLVT